MPLTRKHDRYTHRKKLPPTPPKSLPPHAVGAYGFLNSITVERVRQGKHHHQHIMTAMLRFPWYGAICTPSRFMLPFLIPQKPQVAVPAIIVLECTVISDFLSAQFYKQELAKLQEACLLEVEGPFYKEQVAFYEQRFKWCWEALKTNRDRVANRYIETQKSMQVFPEELQNRLEDVNFALFEQTFKEWLLEHELFYLRVQGLIQFMQVNMITVKKAPEEDFACSDIQLTTPVYRSALYELYKLNHMSCWFRVYPATEWSKEQVREMDQLIPSLTQMISDRLTTSIDPKMKEELNADGEYVLLPMTEEFETPFKEEVKDEDKALMEVV